MMMSLTPQLQQQLLAREISLPEILCVYGKLPCVCLWETERGTEFYMIHTTSTYWAILVLGIDKFYIN